MHEFKMGRNVLVGEWVGVLIFCIYSDVNGWCVIDIFHWVKGRRRYHLPHIKLIVAGIFHVLY